MVYLDLLLSSCYGSCERFDKDLLLYGIRCFDKNVIQTPFRLPERVRIV